ncbi:MAG: 16S rRNA (guanine(966)-N(2))-methyltransferase RsmD [Clostridia bacterium]|nr:16S rRNA (guanine(966)-N(2))-methyltransferase RsmD [Clostridia bacterium]
MRIITGCARGVRLFSLEGEQTRPTSERVKEAVFSMLQFEIEDRQVLDLFAGSGQMGLEAVSRGAASAVLVDRSRDAVEVIKKNCLKTKLAPMCEVYCSDYTEFLRSCRGKRRFDLVFLDPPYAPKLIPEAIRTMLKYRVIGEGCTLVCEAAELSHVFDGDEALAARFEVQREAKYGAASVMLLRLKEEEE